MKINQLYIANYRFNNLKDISIIYTDNVLILKLFTIPVQNHMLLHLSLDEL